MKVVYCSQSCHKTQWENHQNVCRPFYFFVAGGVKRKNTSKSDQELSAEFLQAVREKQAPAIVLDLYNQMSDVYQKRYQRVFYDYFPRNNEQDLISLDDFDDMSPDNVMYLMVGTVRWGYEVDSLYLLVRDNRRARNPVTNLEFSDQDMALIIDAVEKRKSALIVRLYSGDNPVDQYDILVRVYRYVVDDFDWNRIRFDLIPANYISMIFLQYGQVKALMDTSTAFNEYVHSTRAFWYWLFRKLSPNERHDDESEDLIALGLSLVNESDKEKLVLALLKDSRASLFTLISFLSYANQLSQETLNSLLKKIEKTDGRDEIVRIRALAVVDDPIVSFAALLFLLNNRNSDNPLNDETQTFLVERLNEGFHTIADMGLGDFTAKMIKALKARR